MNLFGSKKTVKQDRPFFASSSALFAGAGSEWTSLPLQRSQQLVLNLPVGVYKESTTPAVLLRTYSILPIATKIIFVHDVFAPAVTPRVDPREAEWLAFLRSLPAADSVSEAVVISAEKLWRLLRPLAAGCPVPRATVTEAGSLFMTWDRGPHHLEIEILPNGRYDWFYRNRTKDTFGGEDDYPVADMLPPDLAAQFRLVAETPRVNA